MIPASKFSFKWGLFFYLLSVRFNDNMINVMNESEVIWAFVPVVIGIALVVCCDQSCWFNIDFFFQESEKIVILKFSFNEH